MTLYSSDQLTGEPPRESRKRLLRCSDVVGPLWERRARCCPKPKPSWKQPHRYEQYRWKHGKRCDKPKSAAHKARFATLSLEERQGMLGQIVSEACRERLLAANAGKGVSPEQRAKIAAWMRRAWDRQRQRVQEAPSDIADSAEHVRRRSQIHRT